MITPIEIHMNIISLLNNKEEICNDLHGKFNRIFKILNLNQTFLFI